MAHLELLELGPPLLGQGEQPVEAALRAVGLDRDPAAGELDRGVDDRANVLDRRARR